jgi:hypothetical protein
MCLYLFIYLVAHSGNLTVLALNGWMSGKEWTGTHGRKWAWTNLGWLRKTCHGSWSSTWNFKLGPSMYEAGVLHVLLQHSVMCYLYDACVLWHLILSWTWCLNDQILFGSHAVTACGNVDRYIWILNLTNWCSVCCILLQLDINRSSLQFGRKCLLVVCHGNWFLCWKLNDISKGHATSIFRVC